MLGLYGTSKGKVRENKLYFRDSEDGLKLALARTSNNTTSNPFKQILLARKAVEFHHPQVVQYAKDFSLCFSNYFIFIHIGEHYPFIRCNISL